MPDYLTHALFAQRLLDGENFSLHDCCQRHGNLFRLGAQGPDLFYYLACLAPGRGYGELGDKLHEIGVTDVLELLHTLDFTNPSYPFACAYLCGYAAHLCLDGIAHPMICARARDLSRQLGCSESCAHVKYENRIESRHFTETTGKPPRCYLYRGDLPATDREIAAVALLNGRLVSRCLGRTLNEQAFAHTLRRLPALLALLFDRGRRWQRVVDRLCGAREATLKWRFKRDYLPDPVLPDAEYAAFCALYEKAVREYLYIVS